MTIQAKPFGESYRTDEYNESDISDLNWGQHGLRFVVELWNRELWRKDALLKWDREGKFRKKYVEIYFQNFSRYRVLEEVDLAPYWKSKEFANGHIVHEILSGGWISHDATGEQLLGYATTCGAREWFISTSNWSAFVLSKNEPLVRGLKD
jgi:hypothetical protein